MEIPLKNQKKRLNSNENSQDLLLFCLYLPNYNEDFFRKTT